MSTDTGAKFIISSSNPVFMLPETLSTIAFGTREPYERRLFVGISTGILLVLWILVSVTVGANWLEAGGLPVTLGIISLTGIFGGIRKCGLLYTLVPAYVFSVALFEGAFLVDVSGPELVLMKIVAAVVLPLLLVVPLVSVGYGLGTGVSALRETTTVLTTGK